MSFINITFYFVNGGCFDVNVPFVHRQRHDAGQEWRSIAMLEMLVLNEWCFEAPVPAVDASSADDALTASLERLKLQNPPPACPWNPQTTYTFKCVEAGDEKALPCREGETSVAMKISREFESDGFHIILIQSIVRPSNGPRILRSIVLYSNATTSGSSLLSSSLDPPEGFDYHPFHRTWVQDHLAYALGFCDSPGGRRQLADKSHWNLPKRHTRHRFRHSPLSPSI